MYKHTQHFLLLTSLLLALVTRVGAQECNGLQGASPDEMTSYLATNARSPEKEACAALDATTTDITSDPTSPEWDCNKLPTLPKICPQ